MVTTERGEWPELLNNAVGNGVSGGRVTLRRQGPPSNSREEKLNIELRERVGKPVEFSRRLGLSLRVWKQMPLEGRGGRGAGALRDERTSKGREPWDEVRTEAGI